MFLTKQLHRLVVSRSQQGQAPQAKLVPTTSDINANVEKFMDPDRRGKPPIPVASRPYMGGVPNACKRTLLVYIKFENCCTPDHPPSSGSPLEISEFGPNLAPEGGPKVRALLDFRICVQPGRPLLKPCVGFFGTLLTRLPGTMKNKEPWCSLTPTISGRKAAEKNHWFHPMT
jgi:hypothetical protein